MDPWGRPIDARPAMASDRAALLDLVRGLRPEEWTRETVAAPWRVRDLVAHVVGDDLSRLARTRDRHDGPDRPGADESFPAFIHRLNARWVTATAGWSTAVLVDQLDATTGQVLALWDDLDLDAIGEPVSWASPEPAPVWLDCARDFTEYWTHHRQLDDAVGRRQERDPAIDHLALDTFLRAVPLALTEVPADDDALVEVVVTGAAGGRWTWRRSASRWVPAEEPDDRPATSGVTLDEDTAWRLCTRGIQPTEAADRASVHGDERVTGALLQVVSVID